MTLVPLPQITGEADLVDVDVGPRLFHGERQLAQRDRQFAGGFVRLAHPSGGRPFEQKRRGVLLVEHVMSMAPLYAVYVDFAANFVVQIEYHKSNNTPSVS